MNIYMRGGGYGVKCHCLYCKDYMVVMLHVIGGWLCPYSIVTLRVLGATHTLEWVAGDKSGAWTRPTITIP